MEEKLTPRSTRHHLLPELPLRASHPRLFLQPRLFVLTLLQDKQVHHAPPRGQVRIRNNHQPQGRLCMPILIDLSCEQYNLRKNTAGDRVLIQYQEVHTWVSGVETVQEHEHQPWTMHTVIWTRAERLSPNQEVPEEEAWMRLSTGDQ